MLSFAPARVVSIEGTRGRKCASKRGNPDSGNSHRAGSAARANRPRPKPRKTWGQSPQPKPDRTRGHPPQPRPRRTRGHPPQPKPRKTRGQPPQHQPRKHRAQRTPTAAQTHTERRDFLKITYDMIRQHPAVRTYIQKADESLIAIGYTEHSFAHVTRVAEVAASLLQELGYSEREVELARIAGYLHDIGNVVNRVDHAQSGAIMAFRLLDTMGAEPEDTATIITAIGNHDEHTAFPVNSVAAALIIADKTDVRDTRVRNRDVASFDIHDRVNYAVKRSTVKLNEDKTEVQLRLNIDTSICTVADYFEIFLERMLLCRKAAEKLNLKFVLRINGQKLM